MKEGQGLKRFIALVFSSIGIFCMLYYSAKYYTQGRLSFEHNAIVGFSIVCTMIIICLILNMYNAIRNDQLKDQISELSKQLERYHYAEMKATENNMECILDIDSKLDKGE